MILKTPPLGKKELDFIRNLGKRKNRDKFRQFYVEGITAFEFALKGRLKIFNVLVLKDKLEKYSDQLKKIDRYHLVTEEEMSSVSSVKINEGIITIAGYEKNSPERFLEETPERVLFLESVGDPANLAGVLRSAENLGFKHIIISGDSVDFYNPRVARASMGGIFFLDLMIVKETEEILKKLKELGYFIYGSFPHDGESPLKIELKTPCVIIGGNEVRGMSSLAEKSCDFKLSIPQQGECESLNLSHALSIIMFSFSSRIN